MLPTGLDGFRLEELLDRGGMGEVYRAYDEKLDRWVAIKVIRSDSLEKPMARRRFLREARTAAQLNHAAIVQIHHILESEEQDCIVMELAEGETLRQLLRDGPLDLERALPLMREIAEGLAAAHAKGIVHRDLKAENVIVTPDGHAKILDFGLAKRPDHDETTISSDGAVIGTFHCMSPEQAEGQEVDHRSDLFSFGVLLYQTLTGQAPFWGKGVLQVLVQIRTRHQRPARELNTRIPRPLSDLINDLLQKDREARPRSAEAVVSALVSLISSESFSPARRPTTRRTEELDSDTGQHKCDSLAETQVLSTLPRPAEDDRDAGQRWPYPDSIRDMGRAGKPPILYVDDEEHNLTVFEAAFEDYYTIHTALSARQALDILRLEEVHLVIADQRMPEMTGVQLLEALIDECPDVVRIILTGFVDIDAVIKAINAGRVYRYVTKPWDEIEFKVIIDRALESYELRWRQRRLLENLRWQADRETELRRTFQKYVPAAMVDELLDPRNADHFLGDARIVAVLISEIRGFTSLSSHLDPRQLVAFLNRYFSMMSAIVARHRGSVNRCRAAALVAAFGAPVSSINNAENAVRAAREMIEALAELNHDKSAARVGEEIRIGVGIHLGEVVAGNIGSDVKMEYTVVGHPVTIAARIQDASKTVPNSILISQSVYDWTKDLVEVETLKIIRLPGGVETLQLYRILPDS